jgi:2-polyprenyl-3-methyl-5-hydroxy-6-metoxy-1,4-benzoquinol methylase
MTEIAHNCPLCGASAAKLFDQRHFRGHAVTNQICTACGLVYQSPHMSEDEREAFYQAEYRQLYQGQAGPNPKDLAVQRARAEATLVFIQPWVKQLTSILDIGCSTGILLQRCQARYQAHGVGVEPGSLYRQYAQDLNLEVYATLDDLLQAQPERFELISMMHVLEHLPDPVAYLQQMREKLLHPAGWLVVEVPNLYAHDCFEVAHLISFSPHSLMQVIQKAGFHPIQLRLHGHPRSQMLPLYITVLAKPDSSQSYRLKPENLVRFKRQVGFFKRRLYTRLFPGRAWLTITENQPEGHPPHA